MTKPCGGCHDLGAHVRWCPTKVGEQASRWGRLAEQVEEIADQVGSNDPRASNHLYAAAGSLRNMALSVSRTA